VLRLVFNLVIDIVNGGPECGEVPSSVDHQPSFSLAIELADNDLEGGAADDFAYAASTIRIFPFEILPKSGVRLL
jgi:hypothetical protein